MKGWIILGGLLGAVYYLATETNQLDEPIAQAEALMTQAERKLDSMTGTTAQKVDNTLNKLKADISDRLTSHEQQELQATLKSNEDLQQFGKQFCTYSDSKHRVFSQENLEFICNAIKE